MIEFIFVITAHIIMGIMYAIGVACFVVAMLGIMAFIEGLE